MDKLSKLGSDNNNIVCYTFQLKYVFWLEEEVSRTVGQTQGEQHLLKLPREITTWNFDSHVISSGSLKPRKKRISTHFCS